MPIVYRMTKGSALTFQELDDNFHEISESLVSLDSGKQDTVTPAASISSAVTNAPTDLNIATTILSVLVGEVNSVNDRYNILATKFNDLIAKLKTQGLMNN